MKITTIDSRVNVLLKCMTLLKDNKSWMEMSAWGRHSTETGGLTIYRHEGVIINLVKVPEPESVVYPKGTEFYAFNLFIRSKWHFSCPIVISSTKKGEYYYYVAEEGPRVLSEALTIKNWERKANELHATGQKEAIQRNSKLDIAYFVELYSVDEEGKRYYRIVKKVYALSTFTYHSTVFRLS